MSLGVLFCAEPRRKNRNKEEEAAERSLGDRGLKCGPGRPWSSGSNALSLFHATWSRRPLIPGMASAGYVCRQSLAPFSSLGLCNRLREVLRAVGPEPKRECHQSRLSIMAQVFGKCHRAGLFNPVACILSAGVGFSVEFTVQANID